MRRSLRSVLIATLVAPLVLVGQSATAHQPAPAATASLYQPTTPTRVLDTRTGVGAPTGKVGPVSTLTVDLSTHLPTDATAVVLNVTGISPGAATLVTAHQAGTARPSVPNLVLTGTEIRSNLVTVPVGADRRISLYNNAGNLDLTGDLFGYYRTGGGHLFQPQDGERVTTLTLGPRQTTTVDLTEYVDQTATAATLSLTAAPSASTFLTVWDGGPRPEVSSLNTAQRATNQATVVLNAGRLVSIYNHAGTVTLDIDLVGFHGVRFGAKYVPVTPTVVFDTRSGVGTRDHRVGPVTSAAPAEILPGTALPDTAIAAQLTLATLDPTGSTAVTLDERDTDPGTTDLTAQPGRVTPGPVTTTVLREHPNQRAYVHTRDSSTHVVAALTGYFTGWVPGCVDHCAYAEGPNLGELGIGTTTTSAPPSNTGLYFPVTDAGDGWALTSVGQLWQWGSDSRTGPVGWRDGRSTMPVPTAPFRDVEQVWYQEDEQRDSIILRRADGTLWGWGQQGYYRFNDSTDYNHIHRTPVRVHDLTDVVALDSSRQTTFVAKSDGTVWSWGVNYGGQLGFPDNEVPLRRTPLQIPGPAGVVDLHAARAIYARTAEGTVWSWGLNTDGELGTGSTAVTGTPAQIPGLTGVTSVTTADYGTAYAVAADGALWAWGDNSRGLLGNGTVGGSSNVPVRVTAIDKPVAEIVTKDQRVFARTTDGDVWAWGDNRDGGLGNGELCTDSCTVPTPRRIALTGITQVTAGQAVAPDGSVWRWGHLDAEGQRVTVPTRRTDVSDVVALRGGLFVIRP
ncbi:hypothetical protein BLA60_07015 [Actinophytocola xinjiangensis]|uniref:Alpha-tubulin suppressor-like RCC1 family protein n=1 Tax=Actinophytocola xinjiangensis TaxID=485602 RepID=A0A7Z0WQD6_9PSEU|nr:hypothetical protein [Actinophytocola xinjiangensis]OLF12991.1 hypothetical protein BLA60_07015 [Actinophytocola xinjiangensis]